MRSTVRKIASNIPEHGLALHGTRFGNVDSIRRTGLAIAGTTDFWGLGHVYYTFIPPKSVTHDMPEGEILERAIGTALEVTGIGNLNAGHERAKVAEADLPAVVIFKGTAKLPFTEGYRGADPLARTNTPENTHYFSKPAPGLMAKLLRRLDAANNPLWKALSPRFGMGYTLKGYRGFGANHVDKIPAEQIAAVVRITPEEHRAIRQKAKRGSIAYDYLVKGCLVVKMLAEMRRLAQV